MKAFNSKPSSKIDNELMIYVGELTYRNYGKNAEYRAKGASNKFPRGSFIKFEKLGKKNLFKQTFLLCSVSLEFLQILLL